jgi:hypothetical protein
LVQHGPENRQKVQGNATSFSYLFSRIEREGAERGRRERRGGERESKEIEKVIM